MVQRACRSCLSVIARLAIHGKKQSVRLQDSSKAIHQAIEGQSAHKAPSIKRGALAHEKTILLIPRTVYPLPPPTALPSHTHPAYHYPPYSFLITTAMPPVRQNNKPGRVSSKPDSEKVCFMLRSHPVVGYSCSTALVRQSAPYAESCLRAISRGIYSFMTK